MKSSLFSFEIKEFKVGVAETRFVNFPSFYGLQKVQAPVYVYRATEEVSPCVVVTACVHGDEINGMRIAQSLIQQKLNLKRGTLIVVPAVNIYGFLNKVRYLPDRKDLNRCFPGHSKGSFGSRFANFIFTRLVKYGDIFIDLHSGGAGRFNIPQIRCDLNVEGVKELVDCVSIPLVVNSSLRDGSFREAVNDLGKPCIVFEGGEGLRIDETITKYGVNLVHSILGHFDMLEEKTDFIDDKVIINKTKWVRAKEGGVLLNKITHGKVVSKGEVVGELRQLTGKLIAEIKMEHDGVILGMSMSSLIMSGDALYHIGFLEDNPQDEEEEFFDFFDLEN